MSPVKATKTVLKVIDEHDAEYHAFRLVDPDNALDQVRNAEERWRAGKPLGPLDGVLSSIKALFLAQGWPTLFLAQGWPTLRGSHCIDRDQPREVDGPVTARMRENGPVLLGKTTTSELGGKAVTDSPLDGITRNPVSRVTCGTRPLTPGRGLPRGAPPRHPGLHAAFSPTLGYLDVEPEIAILVTSAVTALDEAGLGVEDIDPGFIDPIDAFTVLRLTGVAKWLDTFPAEAPDRIDPGLHRLWEQGHAYSALDYLDASEIRAALGIRMGEFHTRYGVLLTPVVAISPFTAGHEVPLGSELGSWSRWAQFSYPFNMTQQPARSMPVGFTAQGLAGGTAGHGPAPLRRPGACGGPARRGNSVRCFEQEQLSFLVRGLRLGVHGLVRVRSALELMNGCGSRRCAEQSSGKWWARSRASNQPRITENFVVVPPGRVRD